MKLRFLAPAERELEEAEAHYATRAPQLGEDFVLEVRAAADRILEWQEAWTEIEPGIRRCLVGRFPFALLYAIEADVVLILAVMHLHRDPNYWRGRIVPEKRRIPKA